MIYNPQSIRLTEEEVREALAFYFNERVYKDAIQVTAVTKVYKNDVSAPVEFEVVVEPKIEAKEAFGIEVHA